MTAALSHDDSPETLQPQAFITQVARSFGKACDSYVAAARLQQQVALDALTYLRADKSGHLLDLGCGPGWAHSRLQQYCATLSAVDLSAGMLQKAAAQQLATHCIQADAARLPFADNSLNQVFSSLMLQWCPKPAAVFSEIARVLQPGGQAIITTLVEGSLDELRQAFASLDNHQHVNTFLSADVVSAAAAQASSMQWQCEQRRYRLYYPDVKNLARELKALGANQVAGKRQAGLTGKRYWQQLALAYEPHRTMLGLVASYQVVVLRGVKHGAA